MIFKNSRYTATYLYYNSKGNLVFKNRKRFEFNMTKAKVITYKEGDRLDLISYTHYNTPQLWWVILDANPQYRWEGEIPYGAELNIPEYNEVMKCLKS